MLPSRRLDLDMRLLLTVLLSVCVLALTPLMRRETAQAQQILIDTTATQYAEYAKDVDALAEGPLTYWIKVVNLPGWKVMLRADTLTDASAQTYSREEYRSALIVVDMRQLPHVDVAELLLHELLHIKLSPYTTSARMAAGPHGPVLQDLMRREEALVTDLTRSYLWRP